MTMMMKLLFPGQGAGKTRPFAPALFLIAAATAVLLLPAIREAGASAFSEESEECFGCHDDDSLAKEMLSGGSLLLYISPDAYLSSAHSDLECTDCHGGISTDDHPGEREIAGLSMYRREQSAVCGDCHDEGGADEKPMHRHLTAGEGQLPCSECHRPHRSPLLDAWKVQLGESGYCLTCHKRDLNLTLGNGDLQSVAIDASALGNSVHLSHECTDCHGEFNSDSHPERHFSSRREHSIVLANLCAACHEDISSSFEDSIHHTLLDEGNLSVPVCTDCHGFHSVQGAETMAQLSGLPCRECHSNIFSAFAGSRHGIGKGEGHFTTPVCTDCHGSHAIKPAYWSERVRSTCLSCHENTGPRHSRWLPNAGIHLEAVSCPSCHAPEAERGVDLVLGNGFPAGAFPPEEIASILGPGDWDEKVIDGLGLWRLLRRAQQVEGEGKVSLEGRIMIRTGIEAHSLSGRDGALRECESCHNPDAATIGNLSVIIMTEDGRPLRIKAKSEVLGAITSVDSLKGFYMLAGTRIKILDLLLILAVLGGMSVPALHMTARILTAKSSGEKAQ